MTKRDDRTAREAAARRKLAEAAEELAAVLSETRLTREQAEALTRRAT